MKKGKVIKLVLAIFLLVALVGGYVFMTVKQKSEEETESSDDDSFNIVSVVQDGINKISYDKDGTEIVLSLKDDTWECQTDPKCKVDQYKAKNMLDKLTDLDATRKIQGDEVDLDAFGLKEPTKVIRYSNENGEESVFTFGMYNKTVDKYYFQKNGDDNVYLVDTTLFNLCDYDLLGLAEVEEYPSLGSQDVYQFSIAYDGKKTFYVDQADAAHKKNADEIPDCEWKSGASSDKAKKDAADEASDLISAIQNLSNSETVSYDKTDSQMKKFGLNSPTLTLQVKYTEMESTGTDEETDAVKDAKILDKEFTLYVGKNDEASGEYYVTTADSNSIYTMNVSKIDALMGETTE